MEFFSKVISWIEARLRRDAETEKQGDFFDTLHEERKKKDDAMRKKYMSEREQDAQGEG